MGTIALILLSSGILLLAIGRLGDLFIESNKKESQERKLLEDYERYLDKRILGKHTARASKQLIDDYLANRNNT